MPKKKSHSINNLILFVLYSEPGGRCGFERLIKECFVAFPQVFALKGYTQWPDTRKLDSALRALRKKKLVAGDPKTFFALTRQGKNKAREIATLIRQKKLL